MAGKKEDIGELKEWLAKRMAEEDLSAEEVSEFTAWLTSRSCDKRHNDIAAKPSGISVGDVVELVGWLKGRMKDAVVKPHEKRDLFGWLTGRISTHTCLSPEEMKHINDTIGGDEAN